MNRAPQLSTGRRCASRVALSLKADRCLLPLSYSPEQNGKQEVFWAQVEGRLMAMLEGEPELTLALMNTATLAWTEMEYQRKVHSETRQKPLDRWLDDRSVARGCPEIDRLHLDFTVSETRPVGFAAGRFAVEMVEMGGARDRGLTDGRSWH